MNEADDLEERIDTVNTEYKLSYDTAQKWKAERSALVVEYYQTHTFEETVNRFKSSAHYMRSILKANAALRLEDTPAVIDFKPGL